MPPLGPKDGENIEVRDGEDSVCLKEWRVWGVGGTIPVTLLEKDLSNPGVRMMRLAGLRRVLLGGICTGDGGAERWRWEVVSTIDAVAIGGRDESDGGGILSDRFLRFRARLPGESGRAGFGTSDNGCNMALCAGENGWGSVLLSGGMNFGNDNGIADGDSGEELGEASVVDGESKVGIVVVGDESADPEVTEDETLSRCLKGSGRRDVLTVTCGGTRRGLSAALCSSLWGSLGDIPPNTDIKDGNESGSDGGLVCTGMVDQDLAVDLRLKGDTLSESQLSQRSTGAKTDVHGLHPDIC